jgi:hypothetical protein
MTNEYFMNHFLHYPLFYFAGGLFIGHKNSIKIFDELVKKETLKLLQQNKITYEVNIWYLIYLKNHDLFTVKWADHNITMVSW